MTAGKYPGFFALGELRTDHIIIQIKKSFQSPKIWINNWQLFTTSPN